MIQIGRFDKVFVDAENTKLESKTPADIIQWALENIHQGLWQSTAFGVTGLVITDMLHKLDAKIPILFIDTLHHFEETLLLAQQLRGKYHTRILVYKPDEMNSREEFTDMHGDELWLQNPPLYDYTAKVEPAHRAYVENGVKAVFTGRRSSQGGDRTQLPVLELDFQVNPPLLKINPMANWSYEQVWEYIKMNNVPYNALLDQGYKSVGDYHSTVPVSKGESERDGRWKGQEKTECGLHKDYFKLKAMASQ